MRRFLLSLCTAVSILLAACGGGGGGDAPAVAKVNVGGILAGLGAGKSVVIADASGPTASLSANGRYSLSMPAGTTYSLRVQAQPSGQTCTVSNGTGTANADVNNISVNCADNTIAPEAKVVSGTIAGLGTGKTVVLQLNAQDGIQETTVNANGSFQFPEPVVGTYTITVKTAPTGQTCTVATTGGITVTCAASISSFKLSGTVSGNIGVVSIRNAANGDTVTMNTNGAFTFTQPVLQGGSYSVAVFDQSADQTCSAANGNGTANADVGNIQINCAVIVAVAPPAVPPGTPTGLTMTYYVKSFNLAWGAVTAPAGGGPVTYRVFEDPDGAGPMAGTQIAGSLAGTTYTHTVTGLLHTRLNAQYTVQACNSGGCSLPTAAITPNINQAIGYFKASNTDADDWFGGSVALSGDGNTLAVGAIFEDSDATIVNGNQGNESKSGAGAVYVYVRSAGAWSQQAYVKASNAGANDYFGLSVALSADGNTLAVGADGEASGNGNQLNDTAPGAGAVYVFTRSSGNWSQQAYVKASNAREYGVFGSSVALSADGDTLAVGAFGDDSNATGINGAQASTGTSNAGAVYVFTRIGVTWTQQAYVKASNTDAGDYFGSRVALAANGNTLAVAAVLESSAATGVNSSNQADNTSAGAGAVYVFSRTGSSWSQQAYVKASTNGAGDYFGISVALSGDGSTLAVGANRESSSATGINGNQTNDSALHSGAVYVFSRAGTTWSQQAYVKTGTTHAGDEFGTDVALSADGNTLAVTAYFESGGTTGINGDPANNSANRSGAAYVFTRTGGTWSQQAYVKAGNAETGDRFGVSAALSADGNTLAVGSSHESSDAAGINGDQTNNNRLRAGAVYMY